VKRELIFLAFVAAILVALLVVLVWSVVFALGD
jgi:hypothetical protein